MCGSMVVITFTLLLVTSLAFSVIVTKMQTACPSVLPPLLRSWAFLPLPLHSLDPWDRVIVAALGCCCSKRQETARDDLEEVIIHKKKTSNGGAGSAPLKDFPSVVYKNLPLPPETGAPAILPLVPQLGAVPRLELQQACSWG